MRAGLFLQYASVCLAFLLPNSSIAQTDLPWKEIKDTEGLQSNYVFSICHSKDGRVWMGLETGLSRFDGYRVENIPLMEEGQSIQTPVYALKETTKGLIWCATKNGLKIYDPNQKKLIPHALSEERTLEDILQISETKYLISYYWGFYEITTDQNAIPIAVIDHPLSKLTKNKQNIITEFYVDKDQLYIGVLGLGIYSGPIESLAQWEKYTPIVNTDSVGYGIFKTPSKIIGRVGSSLMLNYLDQGLYRWDINSKKMSPIPGFTKADTQGFTVITAATLEQEQLYISQLGQGLVQLDLSKNNRKPQVYTFSSLPNFNFWDNQIYAISINGKSIWLGTTGDGVKYAPLQNEGIQTLNLGAYVNKNTPLYSVKADKNNNLWVATFGDGLLKLELENDQVKKINKIQKNAQNGLPSDSLNELHFAQNGTMWVSSNEGVVQYSREAINELASGSEKFLSPRVFQNSIMDQASLSSNQINDIFEDALGNIYLTSGSGLNLIDTKNEVYNHRNQGDYPFLFFNQSVYYGEFLVDSSMVLNGPGVRSVFVKGEQLSINSMLGTDENILLYHSVNQGDSVSWIGTNRGVFKYDGNKREAVQFKGQSFFKDLKINALAISENWLWLGTNQGLYAYDTKNQKVHSFTLPKSEGWPFFHYGAVTTGPDGNVYFGTNRGIVSANTRVLQSQKNQCKGSCLMNISAFKINQEYIEVEVTDGPNGLSLSPSIVNQGDLIEIELGFPVHHLEDGVYFEYNLGDKNWIKTDVNTPEIVLYQLSPGDYTLKIRAKNNSGELLSEARMSLDILGPIYYRWWAIVLYCLIGVLVLGVVILSQWKKIKKRQQAMLEKAALKSTQEVNDLKFELISNISHELRTPLTLMLNDLESIGEKSNGVEVVSNLKYNANRLKKLANELLDLKGEDNSNLKITVKKQNIVDFVSKTVQLYQEMASKREIELEFNSDQAYHEVWFNTHQLEKVLHNLLSNAFKFTEDEGRILVKVYKNDTCGIEQDRLFGFVECMTIEVKDNGNGIAKEHLEHVFESDFSLPPTNNTDFESAGIGLYLSKKIMDLHYGDIRVESEKGQGSTFKLRIPLGYFHYDDDQIEIETFQEKENANASESLPRETQTVGIEKLLVVEDNEDIRSYLKRIFSNTYAVETAKNGIEGIQKAKQFFPDLIITDLSMPGKDGMALIKEIKKEEELSHIPIIVLSSYDTEAHKIEVLNQGADTFMTKPFEKEFLMARVNNLLTTRKQLQSRFSDGSANFGDIVKKSPDAGLLKRTIGVIERNIADPDFDVAALAKELRVSRSLLYLKIPTLTNYSPKEFIHVMRVRRGAKLLKTGQYRINEVADEIGYNTLKNFRKYFKEYFGTSPSDYIKNK